MESDKKYSYINSKVGLLNYSILQLNSMSDYLVTASIVLYKHNEKAQKAINSFLKTNKPIHLFLIDNSPDDSFIHSNSQFQNNSRVTYIFNNKNIGYGSAHNIALRKIINLSNYHIVLNPDIEFDSLALEKCINYLDQNINIGLLMPKVLYPNGDIQYLCKMLNSPFDLIVRRFIPDFLRKIFEKKLEHYELKHKDYNQIMEVPNLSGCFMLMRCEALKTVGLFDEKFFMYLEDTDLCRRINQQYQTIYYPEVSIIHHYEKGSYKNYKLLMYHIRSAFYFFSKWGWFFDSGRRTINSLLK